MNVREQYAHSGLYEGSGVTRGLLLGGLAGLVLGVVYPYVILYVPVVGSITFLITGGYALALGGVVGSALKKGNVRNRSVAMLVVLPVTFFSYWLSWAVWIYAFGHRSDVDFPLEQLLLNPVLLFRCIEQVNEIGAWSLKGSTPTGTALWAIWGGEAAIVFGVSLFTAAQSLNDPYCETCHRWSESLGDVARRGAEKTAAFKERLQTPALLPALDALGTPAPDAKEWIQLKIQRCSQCQGLHTLSAYRVTKQKNGKLNRARILERLVITRPEADGIFAMGGRSTATVPVPTTAPPAPIG